MTSSTTKTITTNTTTVAPKNNHDRQQHHPRKGILSALLLLRCVVTSFNVIQNSTRVDDSDDATRISAASMEALDFSSRNGLLNRDDEKQYSSNAVFHWLTVSAMLTNVVVTSTILLLLSIKKTCRWKLHTIRSAIQRHVAEYHCRSRPCRSHKKNPTTFPLNSPTQSARTRRRRRGALLLVSLLSCGVVNSIQLDCDPCIRRSNYKIKSIVHGNTKSVFWVRVKAAAEQTAKDLGVQFEMNLQDEYNLQQMATDIKKVLLLSPEERPDVLIVTLPGDIVKDAVQQVIQNGIPVFSFNSGFEAGPPVIMTTNGTTNTPWGGGDLSGILGFVGQDEYLSGVMAANEFMKVNSNIKRALFVNHEYGHSSLAARFNGFKETLETPTATFDNDSSRISQQGGGVPVVEELVLDIPNVYATVNALKNAFANCSYDAVLLGGEASVELAIAAFEDNQCGKKTHVGAYDENSFIYSSIVQEKLLFTISQQQFLESVLPVVMATLYVTTGKSISPPAGSEIFMSGPLVINVDNVPSGRQQACASDSFPICPNVFTIDGNKQSDCGCIKRENLRIGAVVHADADEDTRSFFNRIVSASEQAANDMSVELDFHLLFTNNKEEKQQMVDDGTQNHPATVVSIYEKMAAEIKSLCDSKIDGLFVTLPEEDNDNNNNGVDVFDAAIQTCGQHGVPVMSIHSGANSTRSEELGLWLHIGQLEYKAGYNAAQQLIASSSGKMETGYCILHDKTRSKFTQRCEGFKDGIEDSIAATNNQVVRFGGVIEVPGGGVDTTDGYISAIEKYVNLPGSDWEGIGILNLASTYIHKALAVKKIHRKVIIGSFDSSQEIITEVERGNVKFGIDEQPELQGMMPVYLLTWAAYSKQKLLSNHNLETGPKFILPSTTSYSSPGEEEDTEHVCKKNNYKVCPKVPEENLHFIHPGLLQAGYVLAILPCMAGTIGLIWIFYYKHTSLIVVTSQPNFLFMVISGIITSSFSVLPMGAETGYRVIQVDDKSSSWLGNAVVRRVTDNPEISSVDAACMATPWLYCLGFAITFSALIAKILKVKSIYINNKKSKSSSSSSESSSGEYDETTEEEQQQQYKVALHKVLIGIIGIESALLITWQLVSPYKWEREVLVETEDGIALESVGSCTSDHGWIFVTMMIIFHLGCLIYALILCFQTKGIHTQFGENNWIPLSVVCMFQILIIAVPIYILLEHDENAFYILRACGVFLQNFTVLCLIFLPKIIRACKGNGQDVIVSSRQMSLTLQTNHFDGTRSNSVSSVTCGDANTSCCINLSRNDVQQRQRLQPVRAHRATPTNCDNTNPEVADASIELNGCRSKTTS